MKVTRVAYSGNLNTGKYARLVEQARKAVNRRVADTAERKRLFAALKTDTWAEDPLLPRRMRKHWKRGRNRTHNQIVVRSDQYRTFTLTDGGKTSGSPFPAWNGASWCGFL